jgi:proprotein convertase subtilisin/kexin type 5
MAGYYNDTINNRDCQPCSIIPGCTFCLIESSTSNITCTSCNFDENYQLKRINNSNILNCTCIPGSYLNISGNNCPACNYKCLTCTNSNSCKSCSISIQKRIYDSAISNYCECIPGYFDDEMSTICK